MKKKLTIETLKDAASEFAEMETSYDVIAFISERNLPVDEIGAGELADKILETPPNQGYLTISNALQWRLQYGRVIQNAGTVSGISRVR